MNKLLSTTLALAIGMSSSIAIADSDQVNETTNTTAYNTGAKIAVGTQANIVVKTASQDVTALGASTSIEQVNKDSDNDQYNNAYTSKSVNVGPTGAAGFQLNLGVKNTEQNVGAFGAQTTVAQTNIDSDNNQKNTATGISASNQGTAVAVGAQINAGARNTSQTVTSSGAGAFVTQINKKNYHEDSQGNVVENLSTANRGTVASLGTQVNVGTRSATQNVTALGASAGVTQLNARTGGVQYNTATSIKSSNSAPTYATGAQVNVGTRSATQSVRAIGASTGISQTNRHND
jgi:hypothetical protein